MSVCICVCVCVCARAQRLSMQAEGEGVRCGWLGDTDNKTQGRLVMELRWCYQFHLLSIRGDKPGK